MSESSIGLNVDGAGKKVRTLKRTVGADEVHEEVHNLTDGAGNVIDPRALPSTLLAGEKIVATAGSSETLAGSTAVVSGVVVQAKPANTGNVLVGNATTQKIILTAGESITINIDNLNKVYVDVTVNGEGVNYVGG